MLSLYFVIIGIVTAIATFMQVGFKSKILISPQLIFQLYSFSVAGEKLTLRIRKKMFRAILHQEMAWFDRKENGVGALCAKLSGEAASVQGVTIRFFGEFESKDDFSGCRNSNRNCNEFVINFPNSE